MPKIKITPAKPGQKKVIRIVKGTPIKPKPTKKYT